MNSQIARISIVSLVLLASLIVGTTYWQTWAAVGLKDRQDNAIERVAQFSVRRGLIYASDGTLLAGRRALLKGERADVIAVGPAIPISTRSQLGVPVGVQANLRQALVQGGFDVVHLHEPVAPVVCWDALTSVDAPLVGTFHCYSTNRMSGRCDRRPDRRD